MYVGSYKAVLAELHSEMINSIVNAVPKWTYQQRKHLFLTQPKLLRYFSYIFSWFPMIFWNKPPKFHLTQRQTKLHALRCNIYLSIETVKCIDCKVLFSSPSFNVFGLWYIHFYFPVSVAKIELACRNAIIECVHSTH